MKYPIFLTLIIFFSCVSCENNMPDMDESLICEEYWAEVRFADFCGLSMDNFDFNDSPSDICNADQNDSYTYDDFVSIRVFNYFTAEDALDEHNREEDFFRSEDGFRTIDNLGDKAFATLTSQFGQLDQARINVIKGTFGVFVDINGKASNGANNCFDENSAIDFARELIRPL